MSGSKFLSFILLVGLVSTAHISMVFAGDGQKINAQTTALTGTYLYEIKTPASDRPSYLFAILHHTDRRLIDGASSLETYINRCDAFSTVYPIDVRQREKLIEAMQNPDKKVRKYYSSKEYDIVDGLVNKRLGDELVSYDNMYPLYIRKQLIDAGLRPEGGRFWENELYRFANEHYKEILSLANPALLGALYGLVDGKSQAEDLLSYALDPATYDRNMSGMIRPYLAGDFDALRSTAESMDRPEYKQLFYDKLSLNLARNIIAQSGKQATFFAVDALYFAGDNNLLEELVSRGIEISPVRPDQLFANLEGFVSDDYLYKSELDFSDNPALPISDTVKVEPFGIGTPILENIQPPADLLEDPFGDLIDQSDIDTLFFAGWTAFTPTDGDFSVRLPFYPQLSSNTYRSDKGYINVDLFIVNEPGNGRYYLISRNTYPHPFELKNKVKFFENAVLGAQAKFGGELLAERVISTALYTGKAFVLALPDGKLIRSKFILADNKLYQVMVMADRSEAYSDEINAYIRSFTLKRKDVSSWYELSRPGFSISFPVQPVSQSKSMAAGNGLVSITNWSLEEPVSGLFYFVSENEYPSGYKTGNLNAFYESLGWSVAQSLKGSVIQSEKIKIGKHKGRFYEISSSLDHYKLWLFWKDGHLYHFMAGGNKVSLAKSDLDFFFDSLHFY